jgi:hypothetical protein
LYLSHWPNLEEAFQDFSRKIELFTYLGSSQRAFPIEKLNLNLAVPPDIKGVFASYVKDLDFYLRWHFLAPGYADRDYSTGNEGFYSLPGCITREKEHILATLQPPAGYPYLKDLQYLARRLNEREILHPAGKRLWLTI